VSKPQEAGGAAGFTLIELMISMGLFALIAVAGLALVDGILRVQGRTGQRLDRLGELQRAMFLVSSDLDQVSAGAIAGGGATLSFKRAAPGIGGAGVAVRYTLNGGALVRSAGPAVQFVLGGVRAARWRFWDGTWRDRWPTDPADPAARARWPGAVALEVQLAAPGGGVQTLRRVVTLPGQITEAQP
jgi:general secretion pathway protein J